MPLPADIPNVLKANPFGFTMASTEKWPLGFDMSAQITGTQAVSNPSSVLTDLSNNTTVTLPDSPTVTGNVITQEVRGATLTAGHSYQLAVTCNLDTNTTTTVVQQITCPF